MRTLLRVTLLLTLAVAELPGRAQSSDLVPRVEHVLHISVDGLRPDVITSLGPERLPNFFRLRAEGTGTDNARTDEASTSTLPGHVSQLTGRPVLGEQGHQWQRNNEPGPTTLHAAGSYVASVFDVAHDHGATTALYTGKSKFVLFDNSYDANSGAPDATGPNNGRDKIDTYVYNSNMSALTATFVGHYRARQYGYAFFHFRYPDGQGHRTGWKVNPGSDYAQKVVEVDRLLGDILGTIETTPGLAGRTAIVLTADHGGALGTKGHGDVRNADNYTIPFYVWGPGVAAGADLYALNPSVRQDPGKRQLSVREKVQPVRYGDVANLSLALLGLPAVPGSVFNSDQALRVTPSVEQTVVVFQQGVSGYTGMVDTYVRRHRPRQAHGKRSTLLIDGSDPGRSGLDNQSLLRFRNLVGPRRRQVPPGARIRQATLSLRVVNAGDGGTWHRMLTHWGDEVTWDRLDEGVSADGREAVRPADARVTNARKGTLSVDVTRSVQAWANGAANYGWAILPDGDDGWDVYGSEGTVPPRLVISYDYAPYATRSLPERDHVQKTKEAEAKGFSSTAEPLSNHPNPFSDETTITYSLADAQYVRLEVFDAQGYLVRTLVDETRSAGTYQESFRAAGLAPGLYLVRLTASGGIARTQQSNTMVLVR